MSKRKAVIELQSKPENKAVRRIIENTKPVEFAPINSSTSKIRFEESATEGREYDSENQSEFESAESLTALGSRKLENINEIPESVIEESLQLTHESVIASPLNDNVSIDRTAKETESEKLASAPLSTNREMSAQVERLRIFQTSTPVTRTLTKFQKAAIVVRGENGKQLVELLWRDQMNEKTRDIWDFLCKKFVQDVELNTNEVLIRKRDILQGSGVKSDRTFINAIYTLEDMGLIEVKRLSGNKEGNAYILTDEGREEINGYQAPGV